jgi:hypothetical protein
MQARLLLRRFLISRGAYLTSFTNDQLDQVPGFPKALRQAALTEARYSGGLQESRLNLGSKGNLSRLLSYTRCSRCLRLHKDQIVAGVNMSSSGNCAGPWIKRISRPK